MADGGSLLRGPSREVALHYGAVPLELTLKAVFTSLFLHGSFPQLLANLLALAIFAPNLEDATGRLRFLAFYLLSGIVALGLLVLFAPNSRVPALGASGAVAGVLGGYLACYPRARVISLFPIPFFATIVEVPAVLLAGAWVLTGLWWGLAGLTGPVPGDWAIAFAADLLMLPLGALLVRAFAQPQLIAAKRPPPRPVY